jgi:AraC-like DNA-binding protein
MSLGSAHQHLSIVDDDPSVREALAATLSHHYAVHLAGCGAEAMALLGLHAISAVILDAFLGDERGLDLIASFRALSSARIPLLTGHGSEALAFQAARAGADHYLTKPVDGATVRETLVRLTGDHPPRERLVERVRTYLDAHAGDPLDLDAVAALFGVSEPHLRERFRDAYGRTPRQYLVDVRMQRATRMLQEGRQPVKQVGAAVGYTSRAVFGRSFRRLIGLTQSGCRLAAFEASPSGDPARAPGGEPELSEQSHPGGHRPLHRDPECRPGHRHRGAPHGE